MSNDSNLVYRKTSEPDTLFHPNKASEELEISVFNNFPDIFFIVKPGGYLKYFNRKAKDFLRLESKDVFQKNLWELMPELSNTEFYFRLQKACQNTQSPEQEFEFFFQKTKVWYQVRINASSDNLLVFLKDLNQRKKLDKQKEDQANSFQMLIESIPQMTWTADSNGITEYCNPLWYSYTGLSLKETQEGGIRNLIHPDDLERCTKRWLHSVESGEDYEDELRFRRAQDNTYRWHLARAVPLKDHNGKIIKWFGTTTDIDHHKKTEEALRKSEERFRCLVESNIIGVMIADASGQIVESNDAFLRILGYEKCEFESLKLTWQSITPTEYRDLDEEMSHVLISEGFVAPYEKEYFNKEGKRVPVLVGAALIGHKESKAIALIVDISDRKELEKRKDDFISMASHELKTPVTSIKLLNEVVQLITQQGEDQRTLPFLEKMNRQITNLTNIIRDLLDLSKIQNGQLHFCKEVFEISALIDEVIGNCHIFSLKHEMVFEHKDRCEVFADRERIGQVIMNFLINAAKYSPQAKRIIINCRKTPDDQVEVSVQDFGIGISEEHASHIFQRFYRISDENERTYPGLGIGLYISSKIIEHHKAKIWFESQKGYGSVFFFRLPCYFANIDN